MRMSGPLPEVSKSPSIIFKAESAGLVVDMDKFSILFPDISNTFT